MVQLFTYCSCGHTIFMCRRKYYQCWLVKKPLSSVGGLCFSPQLIVLKYCHPVPMSKQLCSTVSMLLSYPIEMMAKTKTLMSNKL